MNRVEQLSVNQIPVENGLGADLTFMDLAFLDGFMGTVADQQYIDDDNMGIPDGEVGMLDISEDRIITSAALAATQTFVVRTLCYFHAANLNITDSADVGTVPLGYITEVGATYLKIKLLPQNGQLTVVT